MPVKQFNDTSIVSVGYAIDNAANEGELSATEMTYVPYTTEGFSISKETKQSGAIVNDRRPNGSKNTNGSASGSFTTEFGYAPFVLDMLQVALMSTWTEDTTAADGSRYITDGEDLQFFVAEKRERVSPGGVRRNVHQRFFGNLVNEATIEIGNGELVTFQVSTNAAFGDVDEADASTNEDAGGLVTSYKIPASYEIADSSNNIDKIVLKDDAGNPLDVTWTDMTLTISNNVREQPGLGNEFAAGMAIGRVGVSVSGNIYYMDSTILNTHLNNGTASLEITISTSEGTFTIVIPKLKAESPEANSQSPNEDYSQSVSLTAERGKVTLDGAETTCLLAVTEKAAA